jgi:hypothetical protein
MARRIARSRRLARPRETVCAWKRRLPMCGADTGTQDQTGTDNAAQRIPPQIRQFRYDRPVVGLMRPPTRRLVPKSSNPRRRRVYRKDRTASAESYLRSTPRTSSRFRQTHRQNPRHHHSPLQATSMSFDSIQVA